MAKLTPLGEIRARLRALRQFVTGLKDPRLTDVETLLTVAETEAERKKLSDSEPPRSEDGIQSEGSTPRSGSDDGSSKN